MKENFLIPVWQVLKAGLAGLVGTIVHYAILATVLYVLHGWPVFATATGFISGMIVNYFLNYSFVFHSGDMLQTTFCKFATVALVGLGINTLGVYLGVDVFGLNLWVCQLVLTSLVFLLSFLFNRIWTFNKS